MTFDAHDRLPRSWPLFGLRLQCGEATLRPVREADLERLVTIQPDDFEHDPRPAVLPGMDEAHHRARLVYQDYGRSMGTWSPASWSLDFVVELADQVVGVQTLRAEDFPAVRTVDSASWLIRSARGRGIGVAMRMAVLGLAFDHLGALAAVSSARRENGASLGVSRRLGYLDNGISLNASGQGPFELVHMRLTAADWRSSMHTPEVRVTSLEPCLPWFGLTQHEASTDGTPSETQPDPRRASGDDH